MATPGDGIRNSVKNGLFDDELPDDTKLFPDSMAHGANIGPIWADSTQVGPILAT